MQRSSTPGSDLGYSVIECKVMLGYDYVTNMEGFLPVVAEL